MFLLTFWDHGELWLGLKTNRGVVDMRELPPTVDAGVARSVPVTMMDVLNGGAEALVQLETVSAWASKGENGPWLRNESDLVLGPCVPRPGKIICVGLNYRSHVAESKAAVPTAPILFAKFPNTLAATKEIIPVPDGAQEIDYEAELAVVIGKRAKNVSEGEALGCVLGYCIANDLTARDLQFRTSQWLLGKTPDKFLPVGPYLVTSGEIPDPQGLRIRTWVNGHPRQDARTSEMLFSVATLIAYISRYILLEPGDLILTGTPQGVIYGSQNPIWLVPGDEVTVEIDGLGRLTNLIGE